MNTGAGRLGGGKKDLSMLFVYVCVDNYLRPGGRLGFVITQTVFKTKGAGDGFRRLKFGVVRPVYLKPVSVADLSEIQVFEGATNRTAIFVCEKQTTKFEYPVPYTVWRGPGCIGQEEVWEDVLAKTTRHKFGALPVNPALPNSPWLTAPAEALVGIQKVIGQSKYKASAGCTTWLNGVYWVRVIHSLQKGHVLIENLADIGDIKINPVQANLESNLVYPLLRGRDVSRWKAEPSVSIVLAQDPETRTGISETEMKRKRPKTFAYFKQFEAQLRGRSGYKKYFKPTSPFYTIYNVGPYTLAPWKVVWRDMGSRIQVAVVGSHEGKVVCPEHHVMAIPLQTAEEAHYICSVLMSAPVQLVVASYTTSTGISTHVLENVALPKFKPADEAHTHLADLSEQCHAAAALGDAAALADLQAQVDRAAAALWNISGSELDAIQQALDDMKKTKKPGKEPDMDEAEADDVE